MSGAKFGRRSAAALVLIGIVVGAAGAQVVVGLQTNYIASGLFTVRPEEQTSFHVALDDNAGGPVGQVVMRLYDHQGRVVARRTVSLAPGQSATLAHRGSGRFRAHAEVFASSFPLSERRNVVSTVEVGHATDLTAVPRFVCSAGENLETGRQ